MNSMNEITLYCGGHEEYRNFPINYDKGKDIFCCQAKDCPNCITMNDYEQLLQDITEKTFQNNQFYESNLAGMRWRSYGIDYSVLKHKRDRLEILVWNRKKETSYEKSSLN